MTTLPTLPTVSQLENIETPTTKIRTDEDVLAWKSTSGYLNYVLFIQKLNEAVVGCTSQATMQEPGEAVVKTVELLTELGRWIEDIPPRPTPQRFGNLAFRDWGKRLEERAEVLVRSLLPDHLLPAVPLLVPYLTNSFGSFIRVDYGTGHELCFALFLLSLTILRFFQPLPAQERQLVCIVFHKYLSLVWTLQDTYKLEPAGSHGVWGLDDYHFLPYIWGSAQLRTIPNTTPADILKQPRPASNFYDMSISRIHQVKSGPFHEHSPQLYTIATSVPNWAKVNSGLLKMYDVEVLGKRVVVQHVPLGGLLPWDPNEDSRQTISPLWKHVTPTPSHTSVSASPRPNPPSLLPPPNPRSRHIQDFSGMLPSASSLPAPKTIGIIHPTQSMDPPPLDSII